MIARRLRLPRAAWLRTARVALLVLLPLLPLSASWEPAAAQELAMPEPGLAVEFDNGAVYRAFAVVGPQVFVREDTGNGQTVVHVLLYGRFDSLIFRDASRSELYFTESSVEEMLAAAPNVPLDIAYEVYVDNRLTYRVNGVALRGEPVSIEVEGKRLSARPLSLQLFYYDPEGGLQRSVKHNHYFSEDFGLPLRIEYENVTSGEKFAINAKRVVQAD